MIAKHDPDADFLAGFQDKVISFLYDNKNKKCTTGVCYYPVYALNCIYKSPQV